MSAMSQRTLLYSPDLAILGGADADCTALALIPDNTPHDTFTGEAVRVAAKD